jgi:hypothetical protein
MEAMLAVAGIAGISHSARIVVDLYRRPEHSARAGGRAKKKSGATGAPPRIPQL